ncbi:unnamed protein product [Rotaria sp. Silwood2]|nr:unnamed protein product [Rotaria sp. Silwood2]
MVDSDIGELLHYLRIVLDYSPTSRTYIIGAITDFEKIRYGKVSRSNNNYDFIYEASRYLLTSDRNYLLEYLAKIFTIDPSHLGYKKLKPLPSNIFIHNELLGIGSNAMVFNCLVDNDKKNEYTLKISNTSVDKEVLIYKTLYNNKYNIDKVHEYALLFRHPPERIISTVILFNNLHILWEQIKEAHKNNILHCDIRKSNIIEIWNNQTRR